MAENEVSKSDRQKVTDAKIRQFTVEGFGVFTIRRPNGQDIINIGKEYTRLVGGSVILDGQAQMVAKVIAALNLAEQKPDDYEGENGYVDEDGLLEFWTEYQKWLTSFRPQRA